MRIAAHVLLAYLLLVLFGTLWRYLPFEHSAPSLAAVVAVHVGLTARAAVAPATGAALAIGYLSDLLAGNPRGLQALVAGLMCLLGHLVHRRLLLRGFPIMAGFCFVTGFLAGALVLVLRAYVGAPTALAGEIGPLLASAGFTAALGPPVLRLCRVIDARFARTRRERDAALEGIIP